MDAFKYLPHDKTQHSSTPHSSPGLPLQYDYWNTEISDEQTVEGTKPAETFIMIGFIICTLYEILNG
jgi:hypothetical protein